MPKPTDKPGKPIGKPTEKPTGKPARTQFVALPSRTWVDISQIAFIIPTTGADGSFGVVLQPRTGDDHFIGFPSAEEALAWAEQFAATLGEDAE